MRISLKTVRNCAKEAMKAHVIDARITLVSNYRYPGIQVIARRLHCKKASGEPITIENFIYEYDYKGNLYNQLTNNGNLCSKRSLGSVIMFLSSTEQEG